MSQGDCKVNTKGNSVLNVFLQLCGCYGCVVYASVFICKLYLLEGVEKLQLSLASEEASGLASPKEKLSKNISSGPKGKTCSMEQLRKRHVCDLEEFILILLLDIACVSCLVF